MMKRGFVLLLVIIGMATSVYGNTFHRYLNGKVESISNYSITVGGQRYSLNPYAVYRAHDRNSNGSFNEKPVRNSDVKVGQHVYIKVEGSTVHEVIIERWEK